MHTRASPSGTKPIPFSPAAQWSLRTMQHGEARGWMGAATRGPGSGSMAYTGDGEGRAPNGQTMPLLRRYMVCESFPYETHRAGEQFRAHIFKLFSTLLERRRVNLPCCIPSRRVKGCAIFFLHYHLGCWSVIHLGPLNGVTSR